MAVKNRDPFWAGYKEIIRRYGKDRDSLTDRQKQAVFNAVNETTHMDNGQDRMKIVRLVFFNGTHTLEGAALQVPCSKRTAQRWHADFIKLVGKNLFKN